MSNRASTSVLAIVPLRDAADPLADLIEDLHAQEGVQVRVLIVDQTPGGDLEATPPRGAEVVRQLSPSRGQAWRRGLDHQDAEWVLWCLPGTRLHPRRVQAQLARAAQTGADLVTCDLKVSDGEGYGRRLSPDLTPDLPALWEAGVLVRRATLFLLETTAFWPVELKLHRQLEAEGRVAHLAEALVTVSPERERAAAEHGRHDAELLRLEGRRLPEGTQPQVTVLLATHQRLDVFLECVEAYSRQLLPPGTFEIVAVDDGSTDGTPEVGRVLELGVPFTFLHKEADGASRARIFAMPHARGRLVLFVNDDTIPFADNVRTHLEAHRALEGQKAMVLGTFEQPEAHLENALMRLLERTHYVFNYANWTPGEELDAGAFYTCHLSVPREAVEQAGGFDPDFSHYGCEDTDLGVRLEDLGWTIHYRPECRAVHRHFLNFDNLRRRQPLVARAHTRLFLKHPRLLAGHAWSDQGSRRTEDLLAKVGGHLPEIEAACRDLADVNLARLERASAGCAATAQKLDGCLEELYGKVNKLWWERGLLEGCRLHGLSGLADALGRWQPQLPSLAGNAVLLRAGEPGWSLLAEAWLAQHGTPQGQTEDGSLLAILVDPGVETESVQRILGPVVRRTRRNGHAAPVALVPCTPGHGGALFAGARAWIPGEIDRADADAAGTPVLDQAARLNEPPHWPLDTQAPLRVLAWPRWDRADSLAQLTPILAPLAGRSDLCLILRVEPGAPDPTPALEAFDQALRAAGVTEPRFEVLLEPAPLRDAVDWQRLADAVDAIATSPGDDLERVRFLCAFERRWISREEETRLWLAERDALEPLSLPVLQEELTHA